MHGSVRFPLWAMKGVIIERRKIIVIWYIEKEDNNNIDTLTKHAINFIL